MHSNVLNGSIHDRQVGHQGGCGSAVAQTVVPETGLAQAEIVFFGLGSRYTSSVALEMLHVLLIWYK
jgi:hypothetical protein